MKFTSLRQAAPREELSRMRDADDSLALAALMADGAVRDAVRGPAMVRLLWDICRIPDFAKTLPEAHHRLLNRVFRFLSRDQGKVPTDWIGRHMGRLDRTDGDIDTLAGRIAHVRTWTYISHQAEWRDDARHWQERTRAGEDARSDALHAALTQRFVDRRTAALYRGLAERRDLLAAVTGDGEVLVEGQYVGRLRGLKYEPAAAADLAEGRAWRTAANRVLTREITRRAAKLAAAGRDDIIWQEDDSLWWDGAPVARLSQGSQGLEPRVALLSHANFGSRHGARSDQVNGAVEILDSAPRDFEYEGEMAPDVALDPEMMSLYPFCRLSGPANVLIMPSLNAASISAKILQKLGGGTVIGPLLMGLDNPAQIARMDATVSDLVNHAALAAHDALS